MQNNVPAIKIGNHLVGAYYGTYEDTLLEQDDRTFKHYKDMTPEDFHTWVMWRIIADTPAKRLETYLTWEGIHGYHQTVYDIATGKLGG